MDNKLFELKKSCDKEQFRAFISFVIIVLLCGISVLKFWPIIDKILSGYNINDMFNSFVKLGTTLLCVSLPVFTFFRSTKQYEDFHEEFLYLEDKLEQKEIIKRFKVRLKSLSKEKQEEFLNYIGSGLSFKDMFEEIDGLDYENIQLLKDELELLLDKSSKISNDKIQLVGNLRCNTLEYVLEEIESWSYDNSWQVMSVVFNDIKKDKELLRYYLPEVDWEQVNIDLVYDKLFNDVQVRDNGFEYTRSKKIN